MMAVYHLYINENGRLWKRACARMQVVAVPQGFVRPVYQPVDPLPITCLSPVPRSPHTPCDDQQVDHRPCGLTTCDLIRGKKGNETNHDDGRSSRPPGDSVPGAIR
jgi:hypothetical protein